MGGTAAAAGLKVTKNHTISARAVGLGRNLHIYLRFDRVARVKSTCRRGRRDGKGGGVDDQKERGLDSTGWGL